MKVKLKLWTWTKVGKNCSTKELTEWIYPSDVPNGKRCLHYQNINCFISTFMFCFCWNGYIWMMWRPSLINPQWDPETENKSIFTWGSWCKKVLELNSKIFLQAKGNLLDTWKQDFPLLMQLIFEQCNSQYYLINVGKLH